MCSRQPPPHLGALIFRGDVRETSFSHGEVQSHSTDGSAAAEKVRMTSAGTIGTRSARATPTMLMVLVLAVLVYVQLVGALRPTRARAQTAQGASLTWPRLSHEQKHEADQLRPGAELQPTSSISSSAVADYGSSMGRESSRSSGRNGIYSNSSSSSSISSSSSSSGSSSSGSRGSSDNQIAGALGGYLRGASGTLAQTQFQSQAHSGWQARQSNRTETAAIFSNSFSPYRSKRQRFRYRTSNTNSQRMAQTALGLGLVLVDEESSLSLEHRQTEEQEQERVQSLSQDQDKVQAESQVQVQGQGQGQGHGKGQVQVQIQGQGQGKGQGQGQGQGQGKGRRQGRGQGSGRAVGLSGATSAAQGASAGAKQGQVQGRSQAAGSSGAAAGMHTGAGWLGSSSRDSRDSRDRDGRDGKGGWSEFSAKPSSMYLNLEYDYLASSSLSAVSVPTRENRMRGDAALKRWWAAARKWGLLSGELRQIADLQDARRKARRQQQRVQGLAPYPEEAGANATAVSPPTGTDAEEAVAEEVAAPSAGVALAVAGSPSPEAGAGATVAPVGSGLMDSLGLAVGLALRQHIVKQQISQGQQFSRGDFKRSRNYDVVLRSASGSSSGSKSGISSSGTGAGSLGASGGAHVRSGGGGEGGEGEGEAGRSRRGLRRRVRGAVGASTVMGFSPAQPGEGRSAVVEAGAEGTEGEAGLVDTTAEAVAFDSESDDAVPAVAAMPVTIAATLTEPPLSPPEPEPQEQQDHGLEHEQEQERDQIQHQEQEQEQYEDEDEEQDQEQGDAVDSEERERNTWDVDEGEQDGEEAPLQLLHKVCKSHSARVIVIGDVHGCLDELCDLLRKTCYLPGDQVLFLGDLVAKGPRSVEVVRLAIDIDAISVRGNHDHEVVRQRITYERHHHAASLASAANAAIANAANAASSVARSSGRGSGLGSSIRRFPNNTTTGDSPDSEVGYGGGGYGGYGSTGAPRMGEHLRIGMALSVREFAWLTELPYFVRSMDLGSVFVHAGLQSTDRVKLQHQEPWVMMTMRSMIPPTGKASSRCVLAFPWAAHWRGPLTAYFGHDTARGLQVYPHALGIDTGCVYGGNLTAVLLPSKGVVRVPARRVYQQYGKSIVQTLSSGAGPYSSIDAIPSVF